MFDSHLHTSFSTDSKMNLQEAIEKSNRSGLGIIITDHMDINYPIKDKYLFDINKYFDNYSKFRNENLLLGIELGLRTDCVQQNREIALNNDFDYIIGSVHVVNGQDIYFEEYYKNKSKFEAYQEYLIFILDCLKKQSDFIDSLGHIDYISRYAKFEDKEIYYEDFADYIDEILKFLIENEKVLELNTRRFDNSDAVNNLLKIYKRYFELGGKYITLGSDAHNVNSIGNNFMKAKDLAERCGLRIIHFNKRKAEF